MLTQPYKQKINDLIYILSEKIINALAREDYEMVCAAGNAQSYLKSSIGKPSPRVTFIITSSARYFN